jgi:hypothetical protein
VALSVKAKMLDGESEALQLIAELYAVEKDIRGRSADERRIVLYKACAYRIFPRSPPTFDRRELIRGADVNFDYPWIDCMKGQEGSMMEAEKNPFEAVRGMMLENLEKVGGITQSYIDMVERTMRGFPGANEEQIGTFKAYIERQVAANRDFCEKLLRVKDFQEAIRIQVEFCQSQLKAAGEGASQIGAKMADSFKRIA